MMHLRKTVVVTGGTGALGQHVVGAYLDAGWQVWINYRQEERFQRLLQRVDSRAPLRGLPADLTDEGQVDRFFERIHEETGLFDVLVHLAGGFWMGGTIADTPLDRWEAMMRLNLLTTFLCTRKAFSLMKQRPGGKIFTVASRTALDLPAGMGAYSISKAGVIALTRTLAEEGKPYHICANTILPGVIDTPANREAMPDADVTRWVPPQEIARLLVQLSHSGIQNMSGTAIKMYGKL